MVLIRDIAGDGGKAVLALALAGFCAVAGSAQPVPKTATIVSKTPVSKDGTAQAESKPATIRHTHTAKHHAVKAAEPPPLVETPLPDPPPPDWPANAQAQPASVGWNGRELSVTATNSSLRQVLQDVSTATGVKVEGVGTDQRIYGSYGPAPARDVLSQLLEGSGYNVLMVGDQGEGTPRQLVLTAKGGHAAGASNQPGMIQQNQNGDEDPQEDVEQPEQPEPVIQQRPFGGPPQQPGQGRTPQQILQEMQQRQQQLQQQQQQQQPGTQQQQQPGTQPPND
jgi:hypothetical protein